MSETESEFLAHYDAAAFPGVALAVDIVVLVCEPPHLRAVLIPRTQHPFKGTWTLPGGFVGRQESILDAVHRLLRDKAGVDTLRVEQLATFGSLDRDPRTRVVSVAHIALAAPGSLQLDPTARLLPIRVPWAGESGGPVEVVDEAGGVVQIGFDHAAMLGVAVQRLRGKIDYTNVAFAMLPERFVLRDLQRVHETVLDRALNKDAFRRKVLASGLVRPTGDLQIGVGHRPPELYTFTGVTDPTQGRL